MMSWWRPLCWLGKYINHNAIHQEGVKGGQAGSWWDLLFQGLFIFLSCPLDHVPGVVAIMGRPLHCFLMIMVGWLVMWSPILHLTYHNIVSNHMDIFFLFFFFYIALAYWYIKDGSTLLKSRDGGRSLNISIEENMPLFLFNNKSERELWGFREEPTW